MSGSRRCVQVVAHSFGKLPTERTNLTAEETKQATKPISRMAMFDEIVKTKTTYGL